MSKLKIKACSKTNFSTFMEYFAKLFPSPSKFLAVRILRKHLFNACNSGCVLMRLKVVSIAPLGTMEIQWRSRKKAPAGGKSIRSLAPWLRRLLSLRTLLCCAHRGKLINHGGANEQRNPPSIIITHVWGFLLFPLRILRTKTASYHFAGGGGGGAPAIYILPLTFRRDANPTHLSRARPWGRGSRRTT